MTGTHGIKITKRDTPWLSIGDALNTTATKCSEKLATPRNQFYCIVLHILFNEH
jgi:hypothetical protein